MRLKKLIVLALTFAWLAPSGPVGAAETLTSGPQAGAKIPGSFAPLIINGNWKDVNEKPVDRHHSLVVEFGLKPVVLVFARSPAEDATFAFLKKLDARVEAHKAQFLKGGAVFLCLDDRKTKGEVDAKELLAAAKEKEEILIPLKEKTQGLKSLQVGVTYPEGPPAWGLNKKADITIVFYYKLVVKKSLAFEKGELDDKAVTRVLNDLDALVAGLAKKPEPAK
jgi:hypothetical protein